MSTDAIFSSGHSLPPPTLLVDLDGTVVDSLATVRETLLIAVEALGKPRPTEDFLAGIVGPPMAVTMQRLGWSEAEIRRGLAIYMDYYDQVSWKNALPYVGVEAALRELDEQGYRLVVATSKRERIARRTLNYHGLDVLFSFVGGASEDMSYRQSKAEVIGYVLRHLSEDPSALKGSYLMIGDRIHDVDGAATYGISTILCSWGARNPKEWESASRVVATPAELVGAVRELMPL